MAEFSLLQQLEEVDRELELRDRVYPNKIRRGEIRQSVADYHMARMRAVRKTLFWLIEHADVVKAAAANFSETPESQ